MYRLILSFLVLIFSSSALMAATPSLLKEVRLAEKRIARDVDHAENITRGKLLKEKADLGTLKADSENIKTTLVGALKSYKNRIAKDYPKYRSDLRLSKDQVVKIHSEKKQANIAFYPIAANPVTYGHIALMLRLLAEKKVDHVVVVPAGMDDRKPDVTATQKFRTKTLMDTIDRLGLGSMISVSTISQNTSRHGELSLMKWLAMNHNKSIKAFYVAGGDHGFYEKKGKLDTLGKLSTSQEDGKLGRLANRLIGKGNSKIRNRAADLIRRIEAKMGEGFNAKKHTIEAVIVARDEDGGMITKLPEPPNGMRKVKGSVMTPLNFSSSATKIRNAISGKDVRNLVLLPHVAYNMIEDAAKEGRSPYHKYQTKTLPQKKSFNNRLKASSKRMQQKFVPRRR